MTANLEVVFPEYLHEYEHETEAKGYLVGVKVVAIGQSYDLTIYDPVRLLQDVQDEIAADGFFAAANLLVLPTVTRNAIQEALEALGAANVQRIFRHS